MPPKRHLQGAQYRCSAPVICQALATSAGQTMYSVIEVPICPMMKTCSSHLRSSAVLTLILHSLTVLSQVEHDLFYFVGCFDNGTSQILYESDGDEMLYVDFQKEAIMYTIPAFLMFDPSTILDKDRVYKDAKRAKKTCSVIVAYFIEKEKHPPDIRDPPEVTLYSAEEVQRGVENMLVCFVHHFFPPFVKITWTKNNYPVSEGVTVSRYYPDDDLTFHFLSTLMFTPSEGDIYGCTVEHAALDSPKTTIWEPEFSPSGVGLDIFCGVGLSVGFLGVAIGTFLIAKAMQDNRE